MKKLIMVGILFATGLTAQAEPEIKGTVSDLAHFISEVPKTVTVTGEAQVRVPAHRAVLCLRVVNENKSLQESLKANGELRIEVARFLKDAGIPAERIQGAKFSSTPKFGIFGEKAKSYRVENEIRVSVQDEKEFQAAVGAVDKWNEVQFGGVDYEYADEEQQKQSAIAKACDDANDRKKIYEDKLGLKLVPTRFQESQLGEQATIRNEAVSARGGFAAGSISDYANSTPSGAATSFGELIYTAKVSVEYTVQTK
jgi:hypothetical protein